VRLAPTPRAPRLSRSLIICGLYGALGVLAVAIGAIRGSPNIYRLQGISTPSRLVVSPFVGIVVGFFVVFLSRIAVHRLDWARVLHREFHAVVHELNSREIFTLALTSSISEELMFRGALVPAIGLFPSSLLFALLHVRLEARFLPWTAMALVMGLLFGLLQLTLGDLGAPITAHFTINFLNLHYIARTELRA
jgi:membrane protease YdiL (CAAX protease family)